MTRIQDIQGTRARAARPGAIAVAALLLGTTACDGLFDVENPGALSDEDLEHPQMVAALSNSAEGSLSIALDAAIVHGEMVGDGVIHILSFDFAIPIDEGYMDQENAQIVDARYNQLSRARWVGDEMVRRISGLVDNPNAHIGVANSYYFGGLAALMLSDMYREVTFDNQPPMTPAEAILEAISRMEEAVPIAAAAGNATLEAGALGSIARAYRSLYFERLHMEGTEDISLFQEAESYAEQALAVSPNFNQVVRYEQPGSSNGIYNALNSQRNDRMGPYFAFTVDPVSGDLDPRIQHTDQEDTGVRGDPIYFQLKYEGFNDDIPVSRAAEAEIIIAEARLLQNDLPGAVEWINRVRARSNLPGFSSSDPGEIREQIIYERSVEFWLEGRRWQDHRYYEIIPERWAGPNRTAGVHRRWMVSRDERNSNPYYRP